MTKLSKIRNFNAKIIAQAHPLTYRDFVESAYATGFNKCFELVIRLLIDFKCDCVTNRIAECSCINSPDDAADFLEKHFSDEVDE